MTEEDIEMVAQAQRAHFHGSAAAPYAAPGHTADPEHCAMCFEAAEVALAALAGRLLPAGGAQRTERGWWNEVGQEVQRFLSYGVNGLPYREPDRRRTVTTFADGSVLTGPWLPVEEGTQQ